MSIKMAAAAATLLALLGGMAPAHAETHKTCGKKVTICIFHTPGSRAIGFQFRGSAITHFNVRYTRKDGRLIQDEGRTANSNQASGQFTSIESGRTTIAVQACNRTKIGPFSSGSKCTGWLSHSILVN